MPALSPALSQLRKKLEDPEAVGTVLLLIFIDKWGTEFFDWEPETLNRQAFADFGAQLPQINRDKIWALVTYLTTDRFFQNLDLFIHTCNALSNSGADFNNYDPADVQEIAWCLTETSLLEPPDEGMSFSPDIITYIDAKLKEENFSQPPRILEQYASDPIPESQINDALAIDEIDYKSFWDGQASKRAEVDEFIRERLHQLFQDVAHLPLVHADDQARQQLLARADKALATQSITSKQESEVAPTTPSL
jgi:hypothetical protein